MTPPFANIDPHLAGVWKNHAIGTGYELTNPRPVDGLFWRKKIAYDFCPIWDHPLQFVQADGTVYAAGRLDKSDQGSVPVFAQGWVPKDLSPAFYLHDFPFAYGGLFIRYRDETAFIFRQIRRDQADRLLAGMLRADPVAPIGRWRAAAVWAALRVRAGSERLGASTLWHPWRPGDDIPQWPVDERPEPFDIGGYGGGGS